MIDRMNVLDNSLFALQELDLEADRLAKTLALTAPRIEKLEKAKVAAAKAVEVAQRAEKVLQGKAREIEGEIELLAAKRKETEAKVDRVTNQKQLDAMKGQLDDLAAKTAEREGALMELYEQQEAAAKASAAAAAAATTAANRLGEERAEAGRTNAAGLARMEELKAQRAAAASAVEAELLGRYEKLRARLGGKVAHDADDMGCPGCGMALLRADFQHMKEQRDRFFDCNSCGRLVRYVGV